MRLNLYITYKKLSTIDIKKDLVLRAKATNVLDVYFYDEDDALINITGSELYFMIKATPSTVDASAVINKKITSFTDPMNGNTEIELTSTDTSSLLGNYIYQMKILYSSKWYTLCEGNVTFMQSIITRES
jgi:hypothetical protein